MVLSELERSERARDMYEGWRDYALGMDEYWRMKEDNARAAASLGSRLLGPWFAGVMRHASFERTMVARLRLCMLLRARAMGGYGPSAADSSSSSRGGP